MILKNLMPLNTPKISHKMSIRYILKKKKKNKKQKTKQKQKEKNKRISTNVSARIMFTYCHHLIYANAHNISTDQHMLDGFHAILNANKTPLMEINFQIQTKAPYNIVIILVVGDTLHLLVPLITQSTMHTLSRSIPLLKKMIQPQAPSNP